MIDYQDYDFINNFSFILWSFILDFKLSLLYIFKPGMLALICKLSASGRLRQKNYFRIKANLRYIANIRPVWTTK